MASFERRGDHQWRAKIRRNGHPELSKTFDTKADAVDWARETERKIKRGETDDLDPTTQKITVSAAIESFNENVLHTLARGGKGTAQVHLRRIEAKFGEHYIALLRAPALNDWVRHLSKSEDLGPQSVVHHLNTLSSLIRHAQTTLGVFMPSGNPCKLVTRPSLPSGRDRVLRDGEFDLLMRAARDLGDGPGMQPGQMIEPIVKLALMTTMRKGELLSLRHDWIDLNARVVNIPAGWTKNGDGRSVALSKDAASTIQSIPVHKSGRLFGNWANGSSLSKPWQRLLSRAKRIYVEDCNLKQLDVNPLMLSDLHFHDLRHTGTTNLFSLGLNPFEVATMTGHKSMQMLKRYTHVDAAKLAQKLG